MLVVATVWGVWLALATALASALAFNFFHIPPTGRFTIADGENWVALVVFFLAAVGASLAGRGRAPARAARPSERRQEADLRPRWRGCCCAAGGWRRRCRRSAQRLAQALGLAERGDRAARGRRRERRRFALREGTRQIGTLVLPAGAPEAVLRRVQVRIVPALEALLAAALERDALQAEVVETAALRRSDVIKTALLRSVSHDLRSPLTAILTTAEALQSPSLPSEERRARGGGDRGGARASRA